MTEPIRKLGRYELLERIAKGGMGEIYLARMRGAAGFEKTCIIKTILPHLAEEEEFVTKFLDEGRIVVQLVHGNIVPVFDMGVQDGEYFIAMEYIRGRDLRDIMKTLDVRGATMPVDIALYIASEVCKGLDYAHRKAGDDGSALGIVHRDVSPSNVLVSTEGEIKLIDFGIARAAGRLSKTVSGRIQGKFCYMSPEQASGKSLGPTSDIFSAGVVLYELLTGFRPFEGDSDLESLDLVRRCEFDPPSTLNAEVGDEVDEIVGKALAREPGDRFATADQFQVAILQYLYSTGSSPTSTGLQAFLAELFPAGAPSTPAAPLSLEDALELELERLGGDRPTRRPDATIDPLDTTAVSAEQVGVSTPTTRATGPSLDLLASAEPVATVETARRSALVPAVVIAAVLGLLAVALIGRQDTGGESTGEVSVVSEPAGALIYVDGALVVGAQTPHTLALSPGRHELRLEKKGFEARTLPIRVTAGSNEVIDGAATALSAEQDDAARQIMVTAEPSDAVLSVDGVKFGEGTGAPLTVEVGKPVKVGAARAGCQSVFYLVSHAHPQDALHLELTCEQAADAGVNEEPEKPAATPPTHVRVTFKTDPPNATIFVDGARMGPAPQTRRFAREQSFVVRAEHAGHQPLEVSRRAADVRGALTLRLQRAEMGCLDLRLQNPAVGRIAIDGEWLGAEHSKLVKHPLSAGEHEIRVKNEYAGHEVDRTFTVDVPGGPNCAYKLFDGGKPPK